MFTSWIHPISIFVTVAVILLICQISIISGDPESVLQRCCQSGETWARNHTTCTGPQNDHGSIPDQDRLTCLTSLYICCIRSHRRINCERGKEAAKEGVPCGVLNDTSRDCCDGCYLGIQAGIKRMPCNFLRFSFGAPWDEAYFDCCDKSSTNQGVSHQTRKIICEPNNPCSQKCDIVNNQVTCSCYTGFKLASDQATCEDVDECQSDSHTCNPATEFCENLVGGFKCSKSPSKDDDCPPGLIRNHQTQICEDFDECTLKPCPRNAVCVNSYGSYTCEFQTNAKDQLQPLCPPGFALSEINGMCVDVDECAESTHTCNRTAEICQNSHGGYQCLEKPTRSRDCPAGFKWNENTANCEDVDECQEGTHTCNPISQNCVNAVGSYRCVSKASCPHGYRWSGNKCEDVDECDELLDDCDPRSQYCVNTPGSYQCHTKTSRPVNCGVGYTYDASRQTCRDIDECEVQPCEEDQTCENTIGSYICNCPRGFLFDPLTRQCKDLNECQLGQHTCVESQRCANTIGSFTCFRITSCGTGYTLNAANNQCEDDDECTLGTHNCGPGFKCRNIQGSFRCDRVQCPPGQKLLSDGSCKVVVCGRGLEPDDAGNCVDINECARSNTCRRNQHCVNTVGSYRCQNLLNCSPGYELNEFGNQCIDVDECARQIYECNPQQTCKNRPGGYSCECPRGYALNLQRACEDVDECSRYQGQVCSRMSECVNTQGSYVCNCKEGFRKADDDKNCLDIDECAETPNICQQICNNVWGSYQCSCQAGFTLGPDNRSCQDIDECKTYEGRGDLCIGYCVNEPGSFSCSCPPGYRLSSDKRTCQDIDECQEQDVCNGDKQVCLNTRGGFKCNRILCPPNYVRDKDHRNQQVNNDDTVVCRKRCAPNDISCILNETQTVTYQTIVLPTISYLPHPLILTTMRAVTSSNRAVNFETNFQILEGNESGLFDILKGQGVGSLRLTRSIHGPLELLLKILMTIRMNPSPRNRFSPTSRHMAILDIIVSPHDF